MPQGKQVGQCLQRRMHTLHRERETDDREGDHPKKTGETQAQARCRQDPDHENTHRLRGDHQQEDGGKHRQPTAMQRIGVIGIQNRRRQKTHQRKHDRMRQQFTNQAHPQGIQY